jgi:hypothetical protein
MTLITKSEAEQLVKRASSIAKVPATLKEVQAALAGNTKDIVVLLVKK